MSQSLVIFCGQKIVQVLQSGGVLFSVFDISTDFASLEVEDVLDELRLPKLESILHQYYMDCSHLD